MRRSKHFTFIVVVLTAVCSTAFVAQARDMGALRVPPTDREAVKTYPAFTGEFRNPLVTPELWTPSICETSQYCDTIELTLDIPRDWDEIYGLKIDLTWASDTDDMDLWIYDEEEAEITYSNEVGTTGEHILLQEPEQRFFYLVVYHWGGISSGYKLSTAYVENFNYTPPERPGKPFASSSGSDLGAREIRPRGVGGATDPGTPEPGLSPIKKPGADGEAVERDLPFVLSASRPRASSEVNWLLWASVAVLAAALGAGGFFLYRRRGAET